MVGRTDSGTEERTDCTVSRRSRTGTDLVGDTDREFIEAGGANIIENSDVGLRTSVGSDEGMTLLDGVINCNEAAPSLAVGSVCDDSMELSGDTCNVKSTRVGAGITLLEGSNDGSVSTLVD